MKTIIIEDEAPLAAGLVSCLRKLMPDIEILAVVPSVSSAVDAIRSNHDVDLVFSDIRLEDGYCFDVFDIVETSAMIIFTTAYDEYALKAFDYECIDYLLKPYSLDDLRDALARYERRALTTTITESRRASASIVKTDNQYRNRIELDRVDSTIIVEVADICYAEYDLGNVKVHCRNKTYGTSRLSLSNLVDDLDPQRFMKVSRTHIVNIKEVASILPTLSRNKILTLKEPYSNVRIEVTPKMLHELREQLKWSPCDS